MCKDHSRDHQPQHQYYYFINGTTIGDSKMTYNIILNGKSYLTNIPQRHLEAALKDISKYYPNCKITILENK